MSAGDASSLPLATGFEGDEAPAPAGGARRVVIDVAGLSKRYEVYDKPHHRLLQTVLRGRRAYYREFWALRDVSLAVHAGETLGVIGRNGCGKSTLLQLVAGTLSPTLGTVRTQGRIAALLELGSGFNPEFTGRENVYLNGAILGIPRREMDVAFPAIEAFADIGAFIDQPVKTYSSGMMVRLAFAVAVHVTPDILIVDEALSVGDTAFQSKCLDRIRRMQESGVAILLVSHSVNTIIEFCDRAAYLDRGRLVAIGPCREVIERYSNDLTSAEARSAVFTPAGTAAPVAAPPPPSTDGDVPPTQILAVRVTDPHGAPKSAFAHGEEVRITMDLAFHRANPAPCFGIQLKSTDDIALWASTTAYMNLRLAPVAAGERLSFAWSFRALTGGARFVIALGAGDNATGEYRRHDRLSYAGHFDVLPEPRAGAGWLALRAEFVDPRR
ncbi:MAG TPA: ABC transporter ATP-binding protein [Casimicrobiaceae bacterium]|nr:ABC transporter ATP-binding protein [Casimicrobiaceae bacterium]